MTRWTAPEAGLYSFGPETLSRPQGSVTTARFESETNMDGLTEFLTAQWDMRWVEAEGVHDLGCGMVHWGDNVCSCGEPERVRAGIEAERAVLALYEKALVREPYPIRSKDLAHVSRASRHVWMALAVLALAQQFAECDGWKEEWRVR